MTLVTLGSPGLRVGKSPAFLVFRGLARSGRPPTAKPGMRIFSRNVARTRSSWSGGKAAMVCVGAARACGKLILAGGNARRVHGDAYDPADCLVDGERRPHFLHHALGVLRPQHRLSLAHVRLVAADDDLASPPVRVAARQVQRRILLRVEEVGNQG